jgi:hypothetical protein
LFYRLLAPFTAVGFYKKALRTVFFKVFEWIIETFKKEGHEAFDGKVQLLIQAFNGAYSADDYNEYF